MARRRADLLVVEQGLADSRTRAQALILAGAILAGEGERVDKAGQLLDETTQLRLRGQPLPYVSRGGLKLQAALDEFAIDPEGEVCLDVGASSGGFTDCLLQRGARRVYGVDVGYGQMAWKVRSDPRVVVIERCNMRTIAPEAIPEECGIVVLDVSFISLKLVVPKALSFAATGARVVALVKPQFEVGPALVGKGGVVRDPAAREDALGNITDAFSQWGGRIIGSIESPIRGAKGNVEFLLAATF